MFGRIEKEPSNDFKEEAKGYSFPMEWWEDDDCDNDEWSKEWDDFDWDSPPDEDEDEWEDCEDWEED